MKHRILFFAASGLALVGSMASAATFTLNGGGLLGTSSVINADGTGDYISLAAAAADFNSFPAGATANYTFLIRSDLSEPASVPFGNATNGNTVTLRPDTGTSVSVTFTSITDNAGTTGDLIVGANGVANLDSNLVKTDNFVVDGSNDPTTNSRNLSLVHGAVGNAFSSRVYRIVGDSDNSVIKNCSVLNLMTASGNQAISATIRRSGTSDLSPDNFRVENNYAQVLASSGGQAITAGASVTSPSLITAGTAITGMVITGNDVISRTRGIFLDFVAGGTVTNNRVRLRQISAGFVSQAIYHNSSNSANGWVMDISNNVIDELQTGAIVAAQGITAIEITGAPAAPNSGTYNVNNNIISGFNFRGTPAAPVDLLYRAIRSGSSSVVVNAYHNSIYMPNFASVKASAVGSAAAIGLSATTSTAFLTTQNNIVNVQQVGAYGIFKASGNSLTSDYNDLFVASVTGRYGTTNYVTLADWRTGSGQDANSIAIDPFVANSPATGTWVSATDLHFTADPGAAYKGTPIASVTTDIDGQPRSATAPTMGVDEAPAASSVNDWSVY